MVTPYVSKDQWAKRRDGSTNWAAYIALKDNPPANKLDEVLEDCTNIINDLKHIGCLGTNITSTNFTGRLERLCYDMSLRMLATAGNIDLDGADYRFSLEDFMTDEERELCKAIGKASASKFRKVGKVVF